MNRGRYEFADLGPEAVDEIRNAERKISELSGQPITLIAYRPGAEASKPEPQDDAAP